MRRSALAASLLAVLLTLVAFEGTASGHTFSSQTKIRASKAPKGHVDPGTEILVFGRLKGSDECIQGQTVELLRRGPGPDEVLDSDTTDAEGEFSFEVTAGDAKNVYVRFAGSLETSYGHSHNCRKSKSRNLHIQLTPPLGSST